MKILIIEDDQELRAQLAEGLRQHGFDCVTANDGMEGYFQIVEYPFDLAIVDLGLPRIDGIELIRRLRADGYQIPVLILTARGGWQPKVSGLDAGADDYMEKPFHIEELVARCRALLRRTLQVDSSHMLETGPLKLNINNQEVRLNNTVLSLTAFEYKILEYFLLHQNKVISKSTLTDYIYEQDFDRDSNVIEVLVGRLRKKLSAHDNFSPILTLRGRGYQFVGQSEGDEC